MEDFQEFPKILHLGGDPEAKHLIVHSQAEEDAAEGYSVGSFVPKEEGPSKEDITAQAEALGIDVDARWGVKRLQAEISKKAK